MRLARYAAAVLAGAALLLGLSITPAGTTTAGAEAAPPRPQARSALTWNLCGTAEHCPGRTDPALKAAAAAGQALTDPDLAYIMLQEVCAVSHVAPLRKRLGTDWRVYFRPARDVRTGEFIRCGIPNGPGSVQPELAGTAVAVKKSGPGGRVRVAGMEFDPPDPGSPATQGAACLVDDTSRTLACSAHFVHSGVDPDGSLRTWYARQLGERIDAAVARGYRVVVGADLNTTSADGYAAGLHAGAVAADAGAAPTYGPAYPFEAATLAIDYLYFDTAGWSPGPATVSDVVWSDHRMLRGSAVPR
ncbi:endonuclease/exonuclease/phosphatase family protein [Streptomonospora nanhaiensis]|uniref:endonuclease/exonuclease/phosphatase family protein n=1 Tax=Streptomonospora nanhaiensis TaxID=1323731 RepID=UPI001C996CD3|nr:endonuclease/exonuclease/phosphatase family protein [Streptomonospora nanhaiensis]MBX9390181.1 endonuclease/exonuclease/phosphatase family protein [Streptomonospora nanhaiensis]